jgi:hypothetical protein
MRAEREKVMDEQATTIILQKYKADTLTLDEALVLINHAVDAAALRVIIQNQPRNRGSDG